MRWRDRRAAERLEQTLQSGLLARLYEAYRCATRCKLATSLPAKAAAETDMLEQNEEPLDFKNGEVLMNFRPFEIKTVVLKMSTEVAG